MRELDYTKIGTRIRQVRKAKGWSQGELAEKVGICMSFMGHIERGSRIMSMETFAGICTTLGASADELLWGVAHPSDALLDMWNPAERAPGKKTGRISDDQPEEKQDKKEAGRDSYAMYIRIMKSVAEIMNESET